MDRANAVESQPSELNAWEGYSYTGLNTVVEGTSLKITIDSDKAINDIIGFRVFAVNYDGTLVDPDGKAFYVKVGDQAQDWNAAKTVVTPSANDGVAVTETKSAKENVTLTKLTGAATLDWTTDKIGNNNQVFNAYFVDAQGTVLFSTADKSSVASVKDFSKVAKVYTIPTINNWTTYEDDKVYNGELKIMNGDGFVLATLNVSMTKVLPTALPEGFTFKDKQVINGVYNCYMIADNWTAKQATEGSMPIENFINFGKGQPDQYDVTFAASTIEDNKPASITVDGTEEIVVDKSYIDNKTEHETTIVYNYGKISSKKNAKGEYEDVTIAAATIKTVYCCFYKEDVHTWAWATRQDLGLTATDKDGHYTQPMPYSTTLTYGENATAPTDAHIYGKNSIDGTFSTALSATYGSSLSIESATLTSDATGKVDYFDVDLNANSGEVTFKAIKTDLGSNPKADVPSTLTIKCKDSYNHDVTITLKMTVKPRK